MKIRNFTPHTVNLLGENEASFKSEGIARCATTSVKTGEIAGAPIFRTSFGEVTGLPEPKENVFIIVSGLVLSASSERKDLICPNDLIRDEKGRVVGCKSWRQ